MSQNRSTRATTDAELAFIVEAKESGQYTVNEIAEKFNKKFKRDINYTFIRNQYDRYKDLFLMDDGHSKVLKSLHRSKAASSRNAKEVRDIVKAWNQRDDILEAINNAVKDALKSSKTKAKRPKAVKAKKSSKPSMTKELLLSDIHFGKRTDKFNLEVLKKRLTEVTEVTIKEIERDSTHYNVERIVVAMLGDIIESSTMHGLESAKGCEFGNSMQVYAAIKYLYELVLKPLGEYAQKKGIKIDVPCVTGNHDRTEPSRTYHNPGEDNLTYIIYNSIKDMCKLSGFNMNFMIPKEPWQIITIYNKNVMYEHFDNARSADRKGLETLMSKRTLQLGIPLHFMRGGHFHEPTAFGYYKIIVNGSLPGNDSFSSVLGFNCEAAQTLNSYVSTKTRPNPFYKSLVIQLDHIE